MEKSGERVHEIEGDQRSNPLWEESSGKKKERRIYDACSTLASCGHNRVTLHASAIRCSIQAEGAIADRGWSVGEQVKRRKRVEEDGGCKERGVYALSRSTHSSFHVDATPPVLHVPLPFHSRGTRVRYAFNARVSTSCPREPFFFFPSPVLCHHESWDTRESIRSFRTPIAISVPSKQLKWRLTSSRYFHASLYVMREI